MEENKEIKRAMNELKELSEDEELRLIAELREKAIRDESNGKVRWKQEGIKEGTEKRNKEIVKRLIQLGFSIEEIIKITELSEEEIIKIETKK